jgi:HK97 family phage major capsid protein
MAKEKKKKEVKEKEVEASTGLDKKEVKELVDEAVAKYTEKMSAAKKKFDLSGKETDKKEVKRLEKRDATIKWMKGMTYGNKKLLEEVHNDRAKALTDAGTGSTGSEYLVPEEFESAVIKYNQQYNQIRQFCSTVSMNSDVKRLNSLSGEPTAYIVGETNTISSSDMTFEEPVLTAKKYAAINEWSTEFGEDNEVDNILNLMAERIGRAIAKKEQDQFINGTTDGSEGLLQVTGVTTTTLDSGTGFTNVDWDDLSDMVAELQEVDLMDVENARFYMSPSVYNELRQLKTSDNQYYLPAAPNQDNRPAAWGYEIVLVNEMPKVTASASATKFIVFSDLSRHGFVGDRRGITSKVAEEGTVGSNNLFEQDMKALRVTKRTAFTTALEDGIVTLATN